MVCSHPMRASTLLLSLLVGAGALAGIPAAGPLAPAEAHASVSILMSLDELVGLSTDVVVATARERVSVWEELAGGRRIVTYTRLSIDKALVGGASGDVWVRTLGGAVGRIGQQVAGEAAIAIDSTSLLFLARVDGVVVVTGLAQGHYPIVADKDGARRLTPSPDGGTLLPRRGPIVTARERLIGATVDGAAEAVLQTRKALDARR